MVQLTKLSSVENAVKIATSSNPMTALLDLMVLLTLQRQTWEEYWIPRVWGEDGARPTSRPFDIREYQATADSATTTISQLNQALLTARAMLESPVVAGNVSRLRTVVDQSRAELQNVIDSAYRKGVGLIVVLAVALFVALTGARVVGAWLAARLASPRRHEPS